MRFAQEEVARQIVAAVGPSVLLVGRVVGPGIRNRAVDSAFGVAVVEEGHVNSVLGTSVAAHSGVMRREYTGSDYTHSTVYSEDPRV